MVKGLPSKLVTIKSLEPVAAHKGIRHFRGVYYVENRAPNTISAMPDPFWTKIMNKNAKILLEVAYIGRRSGIYKYRQAPIISILPFDGGLMQGSIPA